MIELANPGVMTRIGQIVEMMGFPIIDGGGLNGELLAFLEFSRVQASRPGSGTGLQGLEIGALTLHGGADESAPGPRPRPSVRRVTRSGLL